MDRNVISMYHMKMSLEQHSKKVRKPILSHHVAIKLTKNADARWVKLLS